MSTNPIGSPNSVLHPATDQSAEEVDKCEVISWPGDLSDELSHGLSDSDQQPQKKEDDNELEKQGIMTGQNELNALKERIKQLENELKQKNNEDKKRASTVTEHSPPAKIAKKIEMLNPQNYFDPTGCHEDIEITDDNLLTINYKAERFGWRTVFSSYSIMNCFRSGIFYFEMKIINLEGFAIIGFATNKMPLEEAIGQHSNSYGYRSDGIFGISGCNRPYTKPNPATMLSLAFSTGDVVGCGVYLATRQIISTKNGRRMDTDDYYIYSSHKINSLFPCISLWESGDKIEANFGPNFKFDLATL
ncbi:hypothetical protein niasHT_000603 [Heterodera trifolii]|uniref:B30.2/SPRY domain-containing protein n=1 Tax=Heterodera trifolii TaxID=157864 RepID=A0ABD2LZ01_9BILA